MEFYLNNIIFSKHDLKRKIRIPKELSSMLAEDIGFHIGDGCMVKYRRKDTGGLRYQFRYSGNSKKDLDYFQNTLRPRKKMLYNLDIKIKMLSTENSIYASFYSQALYEFFMAMGIPPGRKKNIPVPEIIKRSPADIKIAFIKGLAAADFCVSVKNRSNGPYPTIKFVSSSKFLCIDICQIMKEFDIPFTSYKETRIDERFKNPTTIYCLDINGRKRLGLWMQRIGFSDERNLSSAKKFFGPGEI